jgi:hypothetical protein
MTGVIGNDADQAFYLKDSRVQACANFVSMNDEDFKADVLT